MGELRAIAKGLGGLHSSAWPVCLRTQDQSREALRSIRCLPRRNDVVTMTSEVERSPIAIWTVSQEARRKRDEEKPHSHHAYVLLYVYAYEKY